MFALVAAVLLLVAALSVGGAITVDAAVFLYLGLSSWALHFAFPYRPWNKRRNEP